MKKIIKLSSAVLAVLIAAGLCACSTVSVSDTESTTAEATENTTAEATENTTAEATKNTTAEATESTTVDIPAPVVEGDFEIETSDGTYTKNGNVYTITSAGTYTLTGALSDGQIIVSAGDDDEVELDLNGVSVTCSTDSPIYVKNADKVKIKAVSGTSNAVNDTRALETDESDTTGSAAIYALCDMNLIGTGTLIVTASYNNGVQTKDDLKIKNLTLCVTAPNNAIKGNDSVTIESGNITAISTSGDGIETDNSDISSKGNQRGTVTISGGTITIYAACDGIDAAYNADISGSDTTITINTHSYSAYTASSAKKTTTALGVTKSADSAKGIKADNSITISDGTIVIKCMDDGIHANNDVALENGSSPLGDITVSGGNITVTAADDGIHADGTLLIEGGYIDIVDSHEGLEAHYITINDGEIHVYATDDGVNATSSDDRKSDGLITVNGGKVYVEVAGKDVDGVDSNGSYKQTGGFVVISNPNADQIGNMSAVDVDDTVSVTGGVIIALGTVPSGQGRPGGRFGMGGVKSSSSLPSGYVTFSGTLSAGTHTFTFGSISETFTLKSKVSNGWIWASGISSSNYTLE